jgi:hypothetical protein
MKMAPAIKNLEKNKAGPGESELSQKKYPKLQTAMVAQKRA